MEDLGYLSFSYEDDCCDDLYQHNRNRRHRRHRHRPVVEDLDYLSFSFETVSQKMKTHLLDFFLN